MRRALAIQMIINREWGLAMNENPLQGSFIVEELTDLVEEAVLAEFERITERGGVLGAMETGYQRGRIQDESMLYEHRKHDGTLPIIGVNTFRPARTADASPNGDRAGPLDRRREADPARPARATSRPATPTSAPPRSRRLQDVATGEGNLFAVLMDAVRVCSLGEITEALFEVGGRYRRNMYRHGTR